METLKPLTRRAFRENQFSRRPFPPCGADEEIPVSTDRRGVTGHTKPLIIAAAPMEIVIACSAINWRLLVYFACCCGSAIGHLYRKSAPDQRQRKEGDCVLTKESAELQGQSRSSVAPDPSKGYTGDYPLCASLVTFCAHRKLPQRSVRRGHFCGNAETADAARLPGEPVPPEAPSALPGGRGI